MGIGEHPVIMGQAGPEVPRKLGDKHQLCALPGPPLSVKCGDLCCPCSNTLGKASPVSPVKMKAQPGHRRHPFSCSVPLTVIYHHLNHLHVYDGLFLTAS